MTALAWDSSLNAATTSWRPGKLWSLWDIMINFQAGGLIHLLAMLRAEELNAEMWGIAAAPPAGVSVLAAAISQQSMVPLVSDGGKAHIKGLLEYGAVVCRQLEMEAALDRIEAFQVNMRFGMSIHDFKAEIRILKETIEKACFLRRFYYYQQERAKILLKVNGDWHAAITGFPFAETDINQAVDCWASEHETACVFHLMRVLEHGLRELAAAVNVTFDVQQWQNVIDEIENQVEWFSEKFPRGTVKSEWTKFYSEAARHFFFLKDAWRNHVSHNRATYDVTSAKGAIEHVRDFMNHLSSRLGESAVVE